MVTKRAEIGMCFDRTFPAPMVVDFARRLDGSADQLWIIEDVFYTAGVSLAAAALTASEQLTVGIGILPTVARNPAITAMEIATLCALAPGRVRPGLGHGVQGWMAQMGARPSSPLTVLDEVMTTVRRLLAGERVSIAGTHVQLDAVQLEHPPVQVPPLYAGVQGAKSVALAGRIADGLIMAEPASPSYIRWALEQAGHPVPFDLTAFTIFCVRSERGEAHRAMVPWLADQIEAFTPNLAALPFADDLRSRYAEQGTDGLLSIPDDWWSEMGCIGTLDDAADHIAALEAAGVGSIAMFPIRDPQVASAQIDDVIRLAAR